MSISFSRASPVEPFFVSYNADEQVLEDKEGHKWDVRGLHGAFLNRDEETILRLANEILGYTPQRDMSEIDRITADQSHLCLFSGKTKKVDVDFTSSLSASQVTDQSIRDRYQRTLQSIFKPSNTTAATPEPVVIQYEQLLPIEPDGVALPPATGLDVTRQTVKAPPTEEQVTKGKKKHCTAFETELAVKFERYHSAANGLHQVFDEPTYLLHILSNGNALHTNPKGEKKAQWEAIKEAAYKKKKSDEKITGDLTEAKKAEVKKELKAQMSPKSLIKVVKTQNKAADKISATSKEIHNELQVILAELDGTPEQKLAILKDQLPAFLERWFGENGRFATQLEPSLEALVDFQVELTKNPTLWGALLFAPSTEFLNDPKNIGLRDALGSVQLDITRQTQLPAQIAMMLGEMEKGLTPAVELAAASGQTSSHEAYVQQLQAAQANLKVLAHKLNSRI